jgi:pyruvate,orthophosphate dikinase
VSKKRFEEIIDELKAALGKKLDIELTAADMKELVRRFKAFYKKEKGVDFPTDPKQQLLEAIKAVFRSWDNPRANVYRRMNEIPYSWGTAVNVQPMVYGNLNNNSGTGVAFTRDPATGEAALFGEYLINAQGEDVVAGVRTPSKIAQLQEEMPAVYAQFVDIANRLETHYRDMQDMEFTIENGTLYMLQTRNGKRTAAAALKIAVDLVREGMITEDEAVLRVEPQQLDALLHPQFDAKALKAAKPIGTGLAASPGAACGRVVFNAADAKEWAERGEKVVLVRLETSPDDIEGMQAAEGILTVRGGMTSHAAVVARGMGTCCVSGCGEIVMHAADKYFTLGGKDYKEGDYISLDGATGKIYGEAVPSAEAAISGDFGVFMAWADARRRLKVRTNADNPRDTAQAVKFGAEGIGLCRTEHMFFEGERIKSMRKMIVAKDLEARKAALAELLPYQQSDFTGMFEALEGRPMTVRFLDPPLHEFLPQKEEEIAEIAGELGISEEELREKVESLHEFNPMMGHRGCRLAVSYPEIAEMQTTAVINAALAVNAAHPDYHIVPEIMIPLVCELKELKFVKEIVTKTADAIIAACGQELKYKVGTMIEIPRAALLADEIAKEAEFFSFGTNDLTQMTFGFSRDDAGAFLDSYYETKIFENDPFARLDQNGVGKLVQLAVAGGRATRPDIKLGICGEHGGDPSSVKFCHKIGLDYVSCSPFRVPIARLAAAQAAIQ